MVELAAVLSIAYRPPCSLMIGFPVLVIETSSRRPLRWMNGALAIGELLAARRKLLEARQTQDFCIVYLGRCSRRCMSEGR